MKISEVANFCAHDEYGRLRVSRETLRVYRTTVNRLLEFFGDVPVASISSADMVAFQTWMDGKNIAAATRNSYIRNVRAFWNRMRMLGEDVCETKNIFRFKKEPKRVKSITEKNTWRMMAATGIRDTAILWLAMDSARRRGGLACLRLNDFRIMWNEEHEEYYIIGQVVEKGEKPQLLMAYHGAALALKAWLIVREELLRILGVEDHGYVFVNIKNGQPLGLISFSALTKKIAQRANIPADQATNLHSFRHRAAKELLKNLSLTEVRDILGHEDITTTANQYAVNSEDELMEAFFTRARRKKGRFFD